MVRLVIIRIRFWSLLLAFLLVVVSRLFFLLFFFLIFFIRVIVTETFPLVLWLQFRRIVVNIEEVEVTSFVMSELVGLSFDPGWSFQPIVVQELVTQDVCTGLV